MHVRRSPGVGMVAPRVRARLDGDEAIAALSVREAPARTAEIGVQRCGMLIRAMCVTARGVRLPDLHKRAGHRVSVLVEHPPANRDPLALGFPVMLPGQVVVE